MSERFEMVVNRTVVNSITNKDLQKQVAECFKALATVEKGHWQYAKALKEINVNDYWRVDFKNLDEFFKAFGVSKPTYYRCLTACNVMEKVLIPNGYNEQMISVTNASILSVLGNALEQFLNSCKASEKHIELMSKSQLEKEVRDYLKQINGAVPGNEETEQEEKEEKKQRPRAEIDGKDIVIKYEGKTYKLPLKVMKQYEVKEEKENKKAEKKS